MIQCRICGTVTGQHGFSFSEQGKQSQAKEDEKNAGILCIPMELIPSGTPEEEQAWCDDFVAELMEHCSTAISVVPPKVMFLEAASVDEHGIPIPAVMKKIIDKYAPEE